MSVLKYGLLLSLLVLVLQACSPVGSEGWCKKMNDKPKGEWTMEETGQYTKYCVLGMNPDKWCEKMEEKPKGDWSANDAAEYTKRCVTG